MGCVCINYTQTGLHVWFPTRTIFLNWIDHYFYTSWYIYFIHFILPKIIKLSPYLHVTKYATKIPSLAIQKMWIICSWILYFCCVRCHTPIDVVVDVYGGFLFGLKIFSIGFQYNNRPHIPIIIVIMFGTHGP